MTIAVFVALLSVVGARHQRRAPADHETSTWRPVTTVGVARRLLAALPVGALDRGVAYDRVADFGPPWADVDHNGCDTRNDILRRDLSDVESRPGTHKCVVVGGTFVEPYTGVVTRFSKAHAGDVQIDHLVPLHAAWMLGAYRWTPAQRLAYANDPLVLVTASGPANQDKGDQLVDAWRPPDTHSWCTYAIGTVVVHSRYELPVTGGERRTLTHLLDRCA